MIDKQWNNCETCELQRGESERASRHIHHNVRSYKPFHTGQSFWYSKALRPVDNEVGEVPV